MLVELMSEYTSYLRLGHWLKENIYTHTHLRIRMRTSERISDDYD